MDLTAPAERSGLRPAFVRGDVSGLSNAPGSRFPQKRQRTGLLDHHAGILEGLMGDGPLRGEGKRRVTLRISERF